MKRFIMFVAYMLAVAAVILFASCKRITAAPDVAVRAMCAAEIALPAGNLYYTDAAEGSESYLPTALLTAYGIPSEFNGIEKAAIRLSSGGHPTEFAVFLCKDADSTEDVSLFCQNRIRSLSLNAAFSSEQADMSRDEYDGYISSSRVVISGRYVALIISSDPDTAKKAFLRSI